VWDADSEGGDAAAEESEGKEVKQGRKVHSSPSLDIQAAFTSSTVFLIPGVGGPHIARVP
jgi:hypothetical protein